MNGREHHWMYLNEAALEMFQLCQSQLRSTMDAFLTLDKDLAEEVIHLEKRVNALDIKIDRECERFLALHQPVAHDLRFVLGLRKMNFTLERIGDHCLSISLLTSETEEVPEERLFTDLNIEQMFSQTILMMDQISEAYRTGNSKNLRHIFPIQHQIQESYRESFAIISKGVKSDLHLTDQYLLLFVLVQKLDALGELIKNIAEEIIFYCEAEVWRHQQENFEWD